MPKCVRGNDQVNGGNAMRGRRDPSRSHYRYASRAKIRDEVEAIRRVKPRKFQLEPAVNLKTVNVVAKEVAVDGARLWAHDLHLLEKYLEKKGLVGSVDDPGSLYFRGQMDMLWGRLDIGDRDVVVFQGQAANSRVIALVGSGRHTFAEPSSLPLSRRHSFLPEVLRALNAHAYASGINTGHNGDDEQASSLNPSRDRDLWAMCLGQPLFNIPSQRVEFLAEILAEHKGDPAGGIPAALLASPIYVARPH